MMRLRLNYSYRRDINISFLFPYLLMNALFTMPRTTADNQLFITKRGITRLQVSRVDSDRDPRE